MIPIYYINLESQPRRRERIERQLAAIGLVGTRVGATTPVDVPLAILNKYCSHGALPQTEPEVACSLSHLAAMTRIAEGDHRYGLILEDDAVLSASLPSLLAAIEASQKQFDIIKLDGPHHPIRVLSRGVERLGGVDLLTALSDRVAATAYLMSKGAAQHVVSHARTMTRPIDLVLFDPVSSVVSALIVRHASPAVAAAPEHLGALNTDSTLERPRLERKRSMSPFQRRRMRWRDAFRRDVLMGSRKTLLSMALGGSHKQEIPFSADLFAAWTTAELWR